MVSLRVLYGGDFLRSPTRSFKNAYLFDDCAVAKINIQCFGPQYDVALLTAGSAMNCFFVVHITHFIIHSCITLQLSLPPFFKIHENYSTV